MRVAPHVQTPKPLTPIFVTRFQPPITITIARGDLHDLFWSEPSMVDGGDHVGKGLVETDREEQSGE
jgi:hypothetical protein